MQMTLARSICDDGSAKCACALCQENGAETQLGKPKLLWLLSLFLFLFIVNIIFFWISRRFRWSCPFRNTVKTLIFHTIQNKA
jgi:hypothetical protein